MADLITLGELSGNTTLTRSDTVTTLVPEGTLEGKTTLNGIATDDDLPGLLSGWGREWGRSWGGVPGGTLTVTWTKESGPGAVTFSNSAAAVTEATFSAPGTYVLRLTADDGELSTFDTVTVKVNPPPTLPPPDPGPGPGPDPGAGPGPGPDEEPEVEFDYLSLITQEHK